MTDVDIRYPAAQKLNESKSVWTESCFFPAPEEVNNTALQPIVWHYNFNGSFSSLPYVCRVSPLV